MSTEDGKELWDRLGDMEETSRILWSTLETLHDAMRAEFAVLETSQDAVYGLSQQAYSLKEEFRMPLEWLNEDERSQSI